MAIKRIGQIMVDLGFITPEQLKAVLDEQKKRPETLFGKVAMDLSLITEEQLAQALGKQLSMPVVSLVDLQIPPDVLKHVTEPMAQLYRIIPIAFKDDTLTIAMCDPQKLSILDELRSFMGFNVRAAVATERDIRKALDRYYAAGGESVEAIIADMEQDAELAAAIQAAEQGGPMDLTSVEALADSEPVRKLLNIIFLQGIRDRASDIPLRAVRDEFKIRMRADGVLFEMVPPPRHLAWP